MTLIFISGPMTGIADLNKPAFMKADEDLQDAGYMTFNPHTTPAPSSIEGMTAKDIWKYYMKIAIRKLTECDEMYLLAHWQNSIGSVWEYRIAKMLGIPIHYQWVPDHDD